MTAADSSVKVMSGHQLQQRGLKLKADQYWKLRTSNCKYNCQPKIKSWLSIIN